MAVCISKSQKILYVSFSWTDSGLCTYHLVVLSSFILLHNSRGTPLPTYSCLVLYSFCVSLLHPFSLKNYDLFLPVVLSDLFSVVFLVSFLSIGLLYIFTFLNCFASGCSFFTCSQSYFPSKFCISDRISLRGTYFITELFCCRID